jgi:hypothetical protein
MRRPNETNHLVGFISYVRFADNAGHDKTGASPEGGEQQEWA